MKEKVTEINRLIAEVEQVSELEEIKGNFLDKVHELLDRDIRKAQAFIERAEARKQEIANIFKIGADLEKVEPRRVVKHSDLIGHTTIDYPSEEDGLGPHIFSKKVEERFLPQVDSMFTSEKIKEFLQDEFDLSEEYVTRRTKGNEGSFNVKVRKAMNYLVEREKVERLNSGVFKKVEDSAADTDDFFDKVKA